MMGVLVASIWMCGSVVHMLWPEAPVSAMVVVTMWGGVRLIELARVWFTLLLL
jgi:hypothetical protein